MEGHDIGTMRYIDLPAEALFAFCEPHLNTVNQRFYKDRPRAPKNSLPNSAKLTSYGVKTSGGIAFSFIGTGSGSLNIRVTSRSLGMPMPPTTMSVQSYRRVGIYVAQQGGKYEPSSPDGKSIYGKCVRLFMNFSAVPCLSKFPKAREPTHVSVRANWLGKTELAKILIHSYIVNHPDTALVIIEPSGKLAPEVARFRENYASDRLIYVTYDRDNGLAPRINPLRFHGVAVSDTSRRALDLKDTYADELVEALAEMIRAEGVQFTDHMQTALRRCLHVLLDMEGSTLRDLVHFMNDAENDELVKFALTRKHDTDGVSYFKTKFKSREAQIAQTKSSLYSRLSGLIIGRALEAITCAGDNTIDLEKEINAKKIIIFELSGRFGPRPRTLFRATSLGDDPLFGIAS